MKPITYRANKYNLGSALNTAYNNALSAINPLNIVSNMTGTAGSFIGAGANSLISNGLESKAGNVMNMIGNGVGNIIGEIPIIGGFGKGLINAATGLFSGLTNRAFGSKMNDENISNVEGINKSLNNLQVVGNNDAIETKFGTTNFGNNFTQSDIGKDGWFSNKAKDKFNTLQDQWKAAKNRALATFGNAADNADTDIDNMAIANYIALGGPLHSNGTDWTNGITQINAGGTHEQNPYEGVPMGIDEEGVPNLVEEGEVVWNDYVFSNRIKVPKAIRQKYKLRKNKEITFAEAAKKAQKESEERPNDPIAKRGLEDIMTKLMFEQEMIREKREQAKQRRYAKGGKLGRRYDSGGLSSLRFAPIIDSGIAAFSDAMGWANTPDYSGADRIEQVAASIPKVKYSPVGSYLTKRYFDRNYASNMLRAEAGATRRLLNNTTSPSRAAALLAADRKAQEALGDMGIKAAQQDLAMEQAVAGYNRDTDKFNSEMGLRAQTTNSEIDKTRYDAAIRAAAMRDTIDSRISAARNANRTNFFNNLGDIGREQFAMDMIRNNPALWYDWLGNYKANSRTKAKGGYLTIKNRRRK